MLPWREGSAEAQCSQQSLNTFDLVLPPFGPGTNCSVIDKLVVETWEASLAGVFVDEAGEERMLFVEIWKMLVFYTCLPIFSGILIFC